MGAWRGRALPQWRALSISAILHPAGTWLPGLIMLPSEHLPYSTRAPPRPCLLLLHRISPGFVFYPDGRSGITHHIECSACPRSAVCIIRLPGDTDDSTGVEAEPGMRADTAKKAHGEPEADTAMPGRRENQAWQEGTVWELLAGKPPTPTPACALHDVLPACHSRSRGGGGGGGTLRVG